MATATLTAYVEPVDLNSNPPSTTVEIEPVLISGESFSNDYYIFDVNTNRALSYDPELLKLTGETPWRLGAEDPFEPDDGEHVSIESEYEFIDQDEDEGRVRETANAALAKFGLRLGEFEEGWATLTPLSIEGATYDQWTLEPVEE
ncbi:hypothetical protein JS532_03025 [Bifidobacterium callimiconis]|uniref:hypothetical protein n=1 Tax=Bifidobacterium callimiconis TaxID=2306973 RepID=UPI001BDD0752|nr:hypothetical protein [Bifidobacterium callimiconis]MBT1176538.1 hypothetical protein [Bifidobacterium callimiconis]